jgi:hypothetical protein
MSVREDDRVQLATLNLRLATVLRALFSASLEETAVDQNAGVFGDDVIRRSRYIAGCSKKTNFHTCSSKWPAPLDYIRPIDAILVRVMTTRDLHVPELFLRMSAR